MPFARETQPGSVKRASPPGGSPSAGVMIGRQPILDRTRRVIGYELVCNATAVSDAPPREAARRTAESILEVGLDRLVRDRRAFLEVPPSLLEDEVVKLLPATRVVVEVPAGSRSTRQPSRRTAFSQRRIFDRPQGFLARDRRGRVVVGRGLRHGGRVRR